jgi:hypothetical protein
MTKEKRPKREPATRTLLVTEPIYFGAATHAVLMNVIDGAPVACGLNKRTTGLRVTMDTNVKHVTCRSCKRVLASRGV